MNVRQRTSRLVVAAGLATSFACGRAPEAAICPDLEEGDLVLSEIRGEQMSSWGQWIELYNASGGDLELFGLRVTMTPLDGSDADVVLVRTEPVEVIMGDRVVLGRFDQADLPEHIDYGWGSDLEDDMFASARLEIEACDVVTDQVVYRNLPPLGTLAFDGTALPTAENNDDDARWCNDATPSPPGAYPTETGVRGTPGEENPPCP